ncbi:flagellar hook-length control protein FliK [Photobacterium lutimaris]|uniref:Flagellar hook-length control protein-like C-terminal domain-containing protein n=1 Tax=Photobacterium lutimaris TaxID=388278 RepID=A0A2T3ING0_9GAMM|nr:flagellar hook-length control protein FliK [Photobacterium lutimaris]PSU29887.1 hypothetical protein C9I99_24450 [Photobacterium lutimaris]TDR75313.1 flagellar hook-length control protein FliK [Photobacterium lutimaris]
MFLSQLFKTDTVPAASAGASKTSAATESQPGKLDAVPDKGFSQTLQGLMGKEPTAEPTSLDAEAKTTDEDGKLSSTQLSVGTSDTTDDVAQNIDKKELIQDGSLEAEGLEESDGKNAGYSTGSQEGNQAGDELSGDDTVAIAVAGQHPGSSIANPDSVKLSMSEGEDFLQRLSASHSQLAGTDGKLLPPDAEALTQEAMTEKGGAVGKETVTGKETLVGKDIAMGKDLAGKGAGGIEGLVAQEQDGAAMTDGKPVKGEQAGKMALSGMAMTNGELKSAQGTTPLSSNQVTSNGAFHSSPTSELAALMGQSSSSEVLKGAPLVKGSTGALAATSLDDGSSASLGETHGPHTTQRTAAAGMLATEGEKPGTAQSPLLLSKEQAGDQLADRVQMMMSKNLKHVDIRLDPPELGKLQIKLSMNNDQASVQITVANQQSRDLVEQAMPRLRELLQQQGLQLAQSTVQQDSSRQFAGGSQQHPNGQPDSSPQRGEQGSGQIAAHELAADSNQTASRTDLWMAAPKDGVDYYA